MVAQTLLTIRVGGSIAALEILIVNSAVSNLIRENKIHQIPSIMQTGQKIGMQMLNAHLMELLDKGYIEVAEAMLKCVDKEDLRIRLKTGGYELQ